MPPIKRAHRGIALAMTALFSCSYMVGASAAITPPKLGGCKPVAEEPADGKQKVTTPSGNTSGNKGQTRPAGEKPGKRT